MDWFLRCSECGGLHVRGSIRHILRYIFSSRYRRVLKELAKQQTFLETLLYRYPVLPSAGTVVIPRLGRLTARPPSK